MPSRIEVTDPVEATAVEALAERAQANGEAAASLRRRADQLETDVARRWEALARVLCTRHGRDLAEGETVVVASVNPVVLEIRP